MHSYAIESKKSAMRLTPLQRSIIVGTLLGDGHLETQDRAKTFRLKIEHSASQRAYVDWLYAQLRTLGGTAPRERTRAYRFPNGSSKTLSCYGFATYSLGALRFYAQQFYVDGKKVIPKLIRKLLDPIAVSIWYLDDGSFKSDQHRTYIIHSHGYVKNDLERVREAMAKFGITISLHRQDRNGRVHWRIYVISEHAERFRELIAPIVQQIPEMQYKLGTHMPKG